MGQIHITNGDLFNQWFVETTGCKAVPFCEAMLSGSCVGYPFDDEFVLHRAEVHQISSMEYREKIQPFLNVIDTLHDEDELVLWFGFDAFCQMNLLTIYETLIQKKPNIHVRKVLFDENQPWQNCLNAVQSEVCLKEYEGVYESVLLYHQTNYGNDEWMNRGMDLFLDLCSDHGRIMQLIQNSLSLNDEALIELVMKETENEGLSDVQALQMINKARRMKMKRGLFVIDYQNDFVDGSLGFAGAERLDEKIAAKVREYGTGNVWFTRDTHFENYLETREGKNLPVVHCVKGTHGWQVYGETAEALKQTGAKAIDKLVFGMDLTDPQISSVLPDSLDEIELVGLVSNICVVSNAAVLQTKYPEATIVVDASCTDSFDKNLHEKVLDVMEGFQVKVINR